MSEGRNQRKVYQGRVVSDKMDKTITVVVETYNHLKVMERMEQIVHSHLRIMK